MTVNQDVMNAIIEQLTISYTVACKTVPTQNIAIVAAALVEALDFSDAAEVRDAFRRARMVQDIPTQRTLAEGLKNLRAERMPRVPEIAYDESKMPIGKRIPTEAQRRYLFAHAALVGNWNFVPYETARRIVDEFEANPKNKEYVDYIKGKQGAI